ncbi:MAG: aminotransferase class I/II-fold pyridoxal phosphate-dependent enzyme [Alphaproteobacteria bacterium]|nr:aminotransferase class I/II-fold pyridoxal phosphate-dependent enzyme [Alphaproteobacteria bacterium]
MINSKFYLTEKLPPYVFASIYHLKQQAVENGFKIIDFGMGNPDSAPPNHVMEELSELSKNPQLYGYSVTGGIEVLKKAICNYYQRRFGVDLDYKTQSLATIGAKEGIASLATAISDDNNYICVPSPSYPIHTFAFVISKSNVVHINAIEASEFLQNFKNFVEKSSKKPKAVIISYPCNPTTQIANLGFYQEIVSFCKKHQIYIISDIAYCELYFDEKDKPSSIMQVKGSCDIAIEFSSISKSYSLAGARVGFAVGNKNLIAALYKIKSYLDYGSFTPLQMIASSALSDKSDEYLIALRKLYKDRSDYFIEKFRKDLGWKIEKPKASMFVWAKLPMQFSSISSFDFCKKMILETGVAMTPGSSFGENGEGHVRFSMIRSTNEVDEAVVRLKKIFSYRF